MNKFELIGKIALLILWLVVGIYIFATGATITPIMFFSIWCCFILEILTEIVNNHFNSGGFA